MPSPRLVISLTAAAIALAASVACGGAGTPDGPTRPPVIVKTTAPTTPPTTSPTTASTTNPPIPTPVTPPAAKPRSASQQNADKMAASYLDTQSFSRSGLIDQLTYEGFTKKEAASAVDSVHADWNAQAAAHAKSYLENQAFSKKSLIEQLEYDGFTTAQAKYGVSKTGL